MDTVIEAKGLVKQYDNRTVVDGLSFVMRKGECFGLIGSDDSGKSTVLRMLYGSTLSTAGELFVMGLNAKKHTREIKSKVGVMPQYDGLDPIFSVIDNLIIHSSYYGIPSREAELRSTELLRQMFLEDFKDRHLDTLNLGMRRRLALARALLNNPELLFLDEPTLSLDAPSRTWFWNHVKKIKSEGKSIVLATHSVEEASQLCDRVALIDQGKILTIGTAQDLIRDHIGKEVVEFNTSEHDLNYYLKRLNEAQYKYQIIRDVVCVHIQERQEGRQVLNLISSSNITIRKPTLGDVFLKLSGHELRNVE